MNLNRKDRTNVSGKRSIRFIIFVMTTMMLCQTAKSFQCHPKAATRISTRIISGSSKLSAACKRRISTTTTTSCHLLSHQQQHRDICSSMQCHHHHHQRQRLPSYRVNGSSTRLFASESKSSSSSTDYNLAEVQRQFQTATDLYQENVKGIPNNLDIIVEELETETADPTFWDAENKDRNAIVTAQLSKYGRLQNRLREWQRLKEDGEVSLEMFAMTDDNEESSEDDEPLFTDAEYASLVDEFQVSADQLLKDGERYQLELLLSGPYDDQPCRILLTAGAGGTEANDWVADLKRMYQRHAQKMGYSIVIEDEQQGDVVGYKSVEMVVSCSTGGGDGAAQHPYGWFKGEKGTHRLVRLSPFNANNKRQTTFAGVDIAPIFLDEADLRDIDIPDKDLEITAMRSGGAGGQNVNKVSSAVRIKHLPSGLNVKCTQQRSQAMNKDLAMKRLKAQLIAIAKEQRVAEIKEIRGDQVEASWGTQIRNYVLHPYKMIKDQRTSWETSNVQNFMDGDLEDCIAELLKNQAKDEQNASLRETDAETASR